MFFTPLIAKSLPYKKTIISLNLLVWILVALLALFMFNACDDSHPQNPTDTKSTTQNTQNTQNTQATLDSTASDVASNDFPFALFSSELDSTLSSVFKPPLEISGHNLSMPILLFFGSPFCKPCKAISQHIAKSTPLQNTLKSHYQAYFINILSKESMQINLPFLAKSLRQKNSTQKMQNPPHAQNQTNPQNQTSTQNQTTPQNPTPITTTQKDFSLALGVRATPTIVFLSAEGEEIFRFVGGISAEHLAIMLDFLKSPPTNKNQQQIALELHSYFKAQNPH